jgi:ribosome biogenesis GTPase
MSELREGTVLRAHSGHCVVATDDGGAWRCRVRGRLKLGPREARAVVVAGDRVRLCPVMEAGRPGPAGVVEEVLPRRNRISRRSSRRTGGRHEQVLMANLDQVVVVQSVTQPAPVEGFVDRLLIAAERYAVAGLLCLNKVDLGPAPGDAPRWDYYVGLGYRVLRASALTGEGIATLGAALHGRVSLLLGGSGTGKSSLLNRLQPELRLRTDAVTGKTGLGRHTTTRTELFPLSGGGFIADSPGLRGFEPWDVAPEELSGCFPDWLGPAQGCRFRSCRHRDEPECGVKAAVARGEIPEWRYAAYLAVLGELEVGRDRLGG